MNRRGFTLLELLVAVAIFSILAAVAYGSLRTMVDTREQLTENMERLAELQMAMIMLQRDVEQAMPRRGIRSEYEEELPAMMSHVAGSLEGGFEFTRGGWTNPMGQVRSTMQRVAYQLIEDELVRHSWRVLDRAVDSEPYTAVVLSRVESFTVQFLNPSGDWQDDWPVIASQQQPFLKDQLPLAVKIFIEVEGWGMMERLFIPAHGS